MTVVDTLCDLIRIDTRNPGGDEGALARVLHARLQRLRPDVLELINVGRPGAGVGAYVFARFGSPEVIVNAHLDTVPPNRGWHADPLMPVVSSDHVVGLGASDVKGSIAAILTALEHKKPSNLAVLFSGDEEVDGACMLDFLKRDLVVGLKRAIVCEPTGCQVGTKHRGIIAFEVSVQGEGGHSSLADSLPAPLLTLGALATALGDFGAAHKTRGPVGFEGMCLNVAQIEGGVAFNIVPKEGRLVFSVRPPPGADIDAVAAGLLRLCEQVAPQSQTRILLKKSGFETRQLESFRPLLGARVDAPIDMGFWTEAAFFGDAGIDAVVFGAGDIDQAHAPNERVPKAHLDTLVEAFIGVIDATN